MEDKRRCIRVRANSVVLYKAKNTRLASGSRIKDVSETGICVSINRFFPIDSLLDLELRLDDSKSIIRAVARVVRITRQDDNDRSPFEVGVLFLDLPVANRNILNDYIRRSIAPEAKK